MSTMLASDANNPNFAGASDPNAVMAVEFYNKPIEQPFESLKAGRPIFKDVAYIRKSGPGDQLNIIDRPMREMDKLEFPRQWMFFENKTKGDSREIGTPVAHWNVLTPSAAEELRALKFYTVEQLAGASDLALQNIGLVAGMAAFVLREKAKAYLNAAAGMAEPQKNAQELAELREKAAKQDATILEMSAQLNALLAAKDREKTGADKMGQLHLPGKKV